MSVVKSLIAASFALGYVFLMGCADDSSDPQPDTSNPVISNLSHTDNQKIIGSRTITLSADVSDDSDVSSVTLTHNSIAQTVSHVGNTYSATITLADRTNNTIVITAADSAGNAATQTLTLDYPFLAFTNGQAASVVIGQPDFDSFDPNQNGSVAANTIDGPGDVKVINGHLYIADGNNNRVLGFNSIPASNNSSADFVIGQDSFTANNSGFAENQLSGPHAITASDSQLFIAHSTFTRINVWSDIPTSNSFASYVIGQSGFVTGTKYDCNQNTFNSGAYQINYVNGKIVASDVFGSRILIWNTVPSNNGVNADIVLGQQSFTNCAVNDNNNDGVSDSAPTESTLNFPKGVWTDGTRIIVADSGNNRVLIWNSFPTSNFASADIVLGQSDFVITVIASSQNATEFTEISAIYSNGNQIFVRDVDRIMIWDSWPTTNMQPADRVLGSESLSGSLETLGNNALLNGPYRMSIYSNRLFVSDFYNNRVLIFEAP